MAEPPRWKYRYDNYRKGYLLLQEAAERSQAGELEPLAMEGAIQRFEFCMELAWKVMKDYLEHQGVLFKQVTPSAVIKQAAACRIVPDGEAWLRALDDRNKMSHRYDAGEFARVLANIGASHMACFSELYEFLGLQYADEG